jgi:hypothetical protein
MMPNKLVNVGLHLQRLKFCALPDPTKPFLEDNVEDQSVVRKARQKNITRIGVELSYAENRALFAVQKLLDDTAFRGNARPVKMLDGNRYHLKGRNGHKPVLDVKTSDFLEAYGIHKRKTTRQKQEFSASGRRSALAALESLAQKSFLLAYTREVYDLKTQGKKTQSASIKTVDHLVEVKRQNGRLEITPSPILFDQHDNYYMILPADLYTAFIPEKRRSLVLFIEYLFYHYEMQRRSGGKKKYWLVRHMETVAYEIGLGNLIETRQRRKLRSTLNKYYEHAKRLGILKEYEVDATGARYPFVDKLHINATAMNALRKVKSEDVSSD